jgi:GntR family transcriptional regulator of arabinose operon
MSVQPVTTRKHTEIADWIRAEIASGNMRPGDRLPSESEICRKFKVSRTSVRLAIANLSREGLVESQKGVGTFCRLRKTKAAIDLALVCFFPSSYIFPRIASGFDELTHRLGFHMLLNHSGLRLEREAEILRKLRARGVGGIALEPINPGSSDPKHPIDLKLTNHALIKEIRDQGIGVVLLDSDFGDGTFPSIVLDDRRGGEMAARYLWERGHRDIGVVCSQDHLAKKLRAWAAQDFLSSVGAPVPERWRIRPETTRSAGQVIEEFFAAAGSLPSAFLCTNDEEAVALYRVASRQGLRVPDNLSLISFDNSDYAQMPGLDLTSIDHPGAFIGEKAAQMLADYAGFPGLKFSGTITVEPVIVERSSVLDLRPRTGQGGAQ